VEQKKELPISQQLHSRLGFAARNHRNSGFVQINYPAYALDAN
jgi:hypothetical protein